MKTIEICPSILNSKDPEVFLSLLKKRNEEEIEKIIYIHLDIIDKDFARGTGRGLEEAELIRKMGFVSDIHLMVRNIEKYVDDTLKHKPAVITIHFEAKEFETNLKKINNIRESKKYPYFDIGVSVNPNTKIDDLQNYKELFDSILIMSVEPGKGNQEFINSTEEKIQKARILFEDKLIQVDGGINNTNIQRIKDAGADRLVIGSYLTKSKNFLELKEKFDKLRKEL